MAKWKRKPWVMPEWMEEFRFLLSQDNVEEWMDCDAVNCNVQVNAPRALICVGVHAEVSLLMRLHKAGKL